MTYRATDPPEGEPATDASELRGAVAATFVFGEVRRDEEFDELNRRILEVARSTSGYLGRKDWTDRRENRAVTYYWESMEALRRFARHPDHREAKRRHREWYDGYRVEVARVLDVYGSGDLPDRFGVPEGDGGAPGAGRGPDA